MCIPKESYFSIIQRFNLSSSMLVKLVNVYMFQCNNKILFVTNGFVLFFYNNNWFSWLLNWSRFTHEMGWIGIS